MTRFEFNDLEVGDYVEFKRGQDAGVVFQAVYIEDYDNICLRAIDQNFAPVQSNSCRKNVKLKVVTGAGLVRIHS